MRFVVSNYALVLFSCVLVQMNLKLLHENKYTVKHRPKVQMQLYLSVRNTGRHIKPLTHFWAQF